MWYQLYRMLRDKKIDIKLFNRMCTMYHVTEHDKIKVLNWEYKGGYITEDEFKQFVKEGYITQEEYDKIVVDYSIKD